MTLSVEKNRPGRFLPALRGQNAHSKRFGFRISVRYRRCGYQAQSGLVYPGYRAVNPLMTGTSTNSLEKISSKKSHWTVSLKYTLALLLIFALCPIDKICYANMSQKWPVIKSTEINPTNFYMGHWRLETKLVLLSSLYNE
jgi:hypothetical protein